MLVVLDSNVLLSALISSHVCPNLIYEAWRKHRFELATCRDQIDELRRASRYVKFKEILQPHRVGKMLNRLQRAVMFESIPAKHIANDPHDSYLLNLADFAKAHHLVTGDRRAGMLELKRVGTAQIITARRFCEMLA